jgi:hypothetical protein
MGQQQAAARAPRRRRPRCWRAFVRALARAERLLGKTNRVAHARRTGSRAPGVGGGLRVRGAAGRQIAHVCPAQRGLWLQVDIVQCNEEPRGFGWAAGLHCRPRPSHLREVGSQDFRSGVVLLSQPLGRGAKCFSNFVQFGR